MDVRPTKLHPEDRLMEQKEPWQCSNSKEFGEQSWEPASLVYRDNSPVIVLSLLNKSTGLKSPFLGDWLGHRFHK